MFIFILKSHRLAEISAGIQPRPSELRSLALRARSLKPLASSFSLHVLDAKKPCPERFADSISEGRWLPCSIADGQIEVAVVRSVGNSRSPNSMVPAKGGMFGRERMVRPSRGGEANPALAGPTPGSRE